MHPQTQFTCLQTMQVEVINLVYYELSTLRVVVLKVWSVVHLGRRSPRPFPEVHKVKPVFLTILRLYLSFLNADIICTTGGKTSNRFARGKAVSTNCTSGHCILCDHALVKEQKDQFNLKCPS